MDFNELYVKADKAGKAAAEAAIPSPVQFVERANPLDDSSPIVRQFAPVMDGLCGFAQVTVKPANSAFAKFLKNEKGARKSQYGGVYLWISDYNQSVTRKEAYAYAFAKVLTDAGIRAYAESRLD